MFTGGTDIPTEAADCAAAWAEQCQQRGGQEKNRNAFA